MTIFYSASTRGFYDDSIHTPDQLPKDVVGISPEYHAELLAGQSAGKIIEPDSTGYPVLKDPPPPSKEELEKAAKAKIDAELAYATNLIAPLQDLVDVGEATPEEEARLKKLKAYRIAIIRVPNQAGYPQTIAWPVRPE